jgi:hypothetical protein
MSDSPDYPPVIWFVWTIHEALRRLGFISDDIFVHADPLGTVAVELRTQNKSFSAVVGPSGMTQAGFVAAWYDFATNLSSNKISQDDLVKRWDESRAKHDPSFITALLNAGFTFPRENEDEPKPADLN